MHRECHSFTYLVRGPFDERLVQVGIIFDFGHSVIETLA